jgi:hypothetical protein
MSLCETVRGVLAGACSVVIHRDAGLGLDGGGGVGSDWDADGSL